MDKWDYIRAISRNGDRYGYNGGIADLLEFYGKINTQEITLEEAKAFLELTKKEKTSWRKASFYTPTTAKKQ